MSNGKGEMRFLSYVTFLAELMIAGKILCSATFARGKEKFWKQGRLVDDEMS